MKKAILLYLVATFSLFVSAQNRLITGKLIDRDTKEGVAMATVQLLKSDSTFIKGTLSNDGGAFRIAVPENGKYTLRFTSVGYTTMTKSVEISKDKDMDLGEMVFSADAIMLKGATVVGQAAKVTVKEDTFVYNASAYVTPTKVTEKVVLSKAAEDGEGKLALTFANAGTVHQLLNEAVVTVTDAAGHTVTLTGAEALPDIYGINILAGKTWTKSVLWPEGLDRGSTYRASLSYSYSAQ